MSSAPYQATELAGDAIAISEDPLISREGAALILRLVAGMERVARSEAQR